jgi:hypothetical protein
MTDLRHSASISVEVSPDALYDLVSPHEGIPATPSAIKRIAESR